MKSFEYAAPENLREATALLGESWGETEILAGGTDLITAMKQGITAPGRLVSLQKIEDLRGVKTERDALRIRAMTPLYEVLLNKDVQKHFPSVVTALKNIASPQILHRGTAGGDLCQRPRCWYYRNGFGLLGRQGAVSLVREGENRYHAIFGTDQPALFVSASSLGPALVALGATLLVDGPGRKTRKIPAGEFFRTPANESEREYALKPNEVLAEIVVPIKGLKNATYEIRHRQGLDWPYVTASVSFMEKEGRVSDARIVLGHVAPTPWLAESAGKGLSSLEMSSIQNAADTAVQGAKPLSQNAYKVQMVKTAVKRALLAAKAA